MAKPIKPKPSEVQSVLLASWHGSESALDSTFAECLTELLTLYYPPFRAETDDELLDLAVTGIRAYAEELCGLSREQLRKAWREVRKVHKTERWPSLAAILDAAVPLTDRPSTPSGDRYRPMTEDEKILAERAGGIWVKVSRIKPSQVHELRRAAGETWGSA
jgi:hypothetical protein